MPSALALPNLSSIYVPTQKHQAVPHFQAFAHVFPSARNAFPPPPFGCPVLALLCRPQSAGLSLRVWCVLREGRARRLLVPAVFPVPPSTKKQLSLDCVQCLPHCVLHTPPPWVSPLTDQSPDKDSEAWVPDSEERLILREEFTSRMHQRFLDGKDGDFDYRCSCAPTSLSPNPAPHRPQPHARPKAPPWSPRAVPGLPASGFQISQRSEGDPGLVCPSESLSRLPKCKEGMSRADVQLSIDIALKRFCSGKRGGLARCHYPQASQVPPDPRPHATGSNPWQSYCVAGKGLWWLPLQCWWVISPVPLQGPDTWAT